ncbi:unnamed protein product [Effrenium voratum]|nr:unnamed protein product [Effrenium voratum]|mmetsp:Transcript_22192/g.52798  ORF Transcript_22192/g.52798 Transcript_22192/m.52798 type:complete len:284 (-) Transcript_22192:14-865(-)
MSSDHLSTCISVCTITVVTGIYVAAWAGYHLLLHPGVLWACLFNVTWALALWSYLQTSLTDPGSPASPEWQAWAQARQGERSLEQWQKDAEEEAGNLRERSWAPGKPTWCRSCRMERPERAHHCASCGCCVLRMDHHCPWIGSCVGWRNHKYFLLLNWWCFWSCACLLLTMTRPSVIEAIGISSNLSAKSILLMVMVLSIMVFLMLTGLLFVLSLYAAMRNATTIEEFFAGANPYTLDSSMDNLTELLGPPGLRWLVPVPCACRRSDGTQFPTKPEALSYGSV